MVPLTTLITLVCTAVLVHKNKAENLCSGASFYRYINKHLHCGVFKSLVANSMDCQKLCADTSNCLSVNTYWSDNGAEICELSKGTRDSFFDNSCFVEIRGHEHFEIQGRLPCSQLAGGCSTNPPPDNKTQNNTSRISNNATGIGNNTNGIGNNATGASHNNTGIGNNTTGIVNSTTGTSNNVTGISRNSTGISNTTKQSLPDGWYQFGSFAYKLFKTRKKWSDAQDTCTDNNAALVGIDSEQESRFIAKQLNATTSTPIEVFDIKKEMKPLKYWKLTESDADITLHGEASYKSAALNLPGTAGSYATTPAIAIDSISFTIAFWVKLDSLGTYDMYSYWYNPNIFCISTYEKSGQVEINFAARRKSKPSEEVFNTRAGNIKVNTWTHVAVTWNRDKKRAEIFQDGSEIKKYTAKGSPKDLDFPVPVRNVFDVGYKREKNQVMKGTIRELVIFDRPLTKEEVTMLKDKTAIPESVGDGVWVGPTHQHTNWAPVLQSNSACITVRNWASQAQMDKIPCDKELEFICEKPV